MLFYYSDLGFFKLGEVDISQDRIHDDLSKLHTTEMVSKPFKVHPDLGMQVVS